MSGNERLAGYDINENKGNIDKFLGFKIDINSYDKEETELFVSLLDNNINEVYRKYGENSLYKIYSKCQGIIENGGNLTPNQLLSLNLIQRVGFIDQFKIKYMLCKNSFTINQENNPEGRYWSKSIEGKQESTNIFADKLNELITYHESIIAKNGSGEKEVFDRQSFLEILIAIKQDYESSGDNYTGNWTDLISTLNEISQKVDWIKNYKDNEILPGDIGILLVKCINAGRFMGIRTIELIGKYIKNINHIFNYDPNDNKGVLVEYGRELPKKSENNLNHVEKSYLEFLKEYGISENISEYIAAGGSGLIDGISDFIVSLSGTILAPDKTIEDIIKGGKNLRNIIGEGEFDEIMKDIIDYTNQYSQESRLQGTYLAGYVMFLLYQITKGTPPRKVAGLKESKLKSSLERICGIKTSKENEVLKSQSGNIDSKTQRIVTIGNKLLDRTDNSNVLRGGATGVINELSAINVLLNAKLGDYMVGLGNDVNKETKLSSEFQEIKSENFDKKNSMNIIDIEKLKIILKDKLIGQIHKYLVETQKLEYVSIEKLKAGETIGMEGKINSNLNEAVDEFIYKITNGVMKNEKGEYTSKVDLLIDKYFLTINQEIIEKDSVKEKF